MHTSTFHSLEKYYVYLRVYSEQRISHSISYLLEQHCSSIICRTFSNVGLGGQMLLWVSYLFSNSSLQLCDLNIPVFISPAILLFEIYIIDTFKLPMPS